MERASKNAQYLTINPKLDICKRGNEIQKSLKKNFNILQ
tara:strand:- start:1034 stop:1150 length:117 start_codon:yes stop_codon:yes gene_type:complete